MKRELDQNLTDDEVYHTACALLVILKDSCGQLHCQKGLNLILFAYKIVTGVAPPGVAPPGVAPPGVAPPSPGVAPGCVEKPPRVVACVRVPGFGFRDPGFVSRAQSFGLWVLGFAFRAPGSGFQVSGVEFRVSGFGSSWSRLRHLGARSYSGFRVSGLGSRGSGSGGRLRGLGAGR